MPYFYIDLESSIIHEKSYAHRLPQFSNNITIQTSTHASYDIETESNEIKISVTPGPRGMYVGATLTKTGGDGEFGEGAVIESISAEPVRVGGEGVISSEDYYLITSSVPHVTAGAIEFTVDNSSQVYKKIDEYDKFKIIPFAHYKVDFKEQLLDEDIQINGLESVRTSPSVMLKGFDQLNELIPIFTQLLPGIDNIEEIKTGVVNSGSPIYRLSENPKGYFGKEEQETKISNFFYGFNSKGAHRYPIHRLDGFKYGVENGGKLGYKYYYKNSSYGNFSDKIMGSVNYASITLRNGDKLIQRTVEKRFVDSDEGYLYESNTSNINNFSVYNNDVYARSTYPYIENSQHVLSQLHVNHPNYNSTNANSF